MGKNRTMSDADRAAILGNAPTGEEQLNAETAAETTAEGTGETIGAGETTETQSQEESTAAADMIEAPQIDQQGVEDTAATQEQAPAPAMVEEPKVEDKAPEADVAVAPAVVAPTDSFGAIGKRVMAVLATYADKMAPRKPVTDAQVIEQQRLLFEAITKTINDSEGDFEALMKAVMGWFEQNRTGVCHETRLFRGMDNIPLSMQDRAAFQRLLNMFKLLSEPQGRKLAIKQVDLDTTLQYGVTEVGRNRVMNFFHQ